VTILFHGRDENEEGGENKVERKRNWVESDWFVGKNKGDENGRADYGCVWSDFFSTFKLLLA
jgi:hypothetical protein